MAKGRPPKPVELKRLEGNPGKRPLPDVVQVAGRALTLPAPLDLPDEALEVWDELVPDLAAAGLLDRIDTLAMEALCVTVARARAAREMIEKEGIITITKGGMPVVHPAVRIERDAWKEAVKIGSEFGLTPVSRTRLGINQLKGRSLAEDLKEKLSDDMA